MIRLGIDLGGTKTEAALVDVEGLTVWKKRVPTPRDDYPATLAAIKGLVRDAEVWVAADTRAGGLHTIGIGIPGSPSPDSGLVRNANSTWLNGRPLQADLETALGRPVQIANDANCLAVSEAADGAACGAGSVFGVILGTGVGGAHVVNGRLLVGANGIAGEWGHTPLPWLTAVEASSPRACWCGLEHCLETYLSGPAIIREFRSRDSSAVKRVEAIVEAAAAGRSTARACLDLFYQRLARALAMIINIADPEVIVIGGGVSNIARIYEEVPARWSRWIFSDGPLKTRLIPAMHGDSSGVRGAAWLERFRGNS